MVAGIDRDPQVDVAGGRLPGRTGDYAFPLVVAAVVLFGLAVAIIVGVEPSVFPVVVALACAGLGVVALALLGRKVSVDESAVTINGLTSSTRIPRDDVVAVGFGRVRWKDSRYRQVRFWVDDGEQPVHFIAAPSLESLTPAAAERLAGRWAEAIGVRHIADHTPEGSDPSPS